MEDGKPFGEPERYFVFSVYGYFTVHRTRCLVFRNGRLPEQTTDANYRYWGIPEYVKIKRALRECVTAHEDGVKLMERSVQAIYKMKNLAQLLATDDGEDKVLQRLQVIDMARGILNSIAIDNEGEDYRFENFSTTGVKDIIDSTCNMLSAVTNIPQTVLFGRSPAGENSTLENYYNMVENIQKQNMKVNVRTVIDLILRQGVYEGRIAEAPKYKVKFAALWSMSDTEQADVAQKRAQVEQTKAQTIAAYLEQGVLDPEEVRRGLAKKGPVEVEEIISEQDLASEGETLDIPEGALPTSPPAAENVEAADSGFGERDSTTAVEPEYEAAAVLIIKDGKALCAARRDQRGLCGPGGCLKPGESPEDAALRESQEEFNIVPLSLIPFGELQAATGRYLRTKLYFADQFSGTPEADGMELIDERWVRIDELHKEPLFPAFEESLKLFRETLRPYVPTKRGNNHDNFADSLDISGKSGSIKLENLHDDGGPGSGNFGHKGVPGQVGGSAPASSASSSAGASSSSGSSAASNAGTSSQNAGASSGGQSVDVKAEIAKRGINTSKMKRDQYKHYKNSSAYIQGKSYLRGCIHTF